MKKKLDFTMILKGSKMVLEHNRIHSVNLVPYYGATGKTFTKA
jgi:hypothetical protein